MDKTLAQTAQEKWAKQAADEQAKKTHDEIIIGLDRVQRAILQGHQASIASRAAHEPKVTVTNQVESVKTPDVKEVVSAIHELTKVERGKKSDYTPIIHQLQKLVPVLQAIPAAIKLPDPVESVEVTNLPDLAPLLEQIIAKLEVKTPEPVVVPAPVVEVTEREIDLSAIAKGQQELLAAIKAIKIPEVPKVDNTPILKELGKVDDAIRTLRFPVTNVATDPLIRYKIADIDDAGTTRYYGNIDPTGGWYIMREDSVAKTYRYATGSADYPDNWTDRASLTYGYMSEALY